MTDDELKKLFGGIGVFSNSVLGGRLPQLDVAGLSSMAENIERIRESLGPVDGFLSMAERLQEIDAAKTMGYPSLNDMARIRDNLASCFDLQRFYDFGRQSFEALLQMQIDFQRTAEQISHAAAQCDLLEDEAFSAVAEGGWLGVERHFTPELLLFVFRIYRRKGKKEMDDTIVAHFNADDAARIAEMAESWDRCPYLHDRQDIVSDALAAHRAGKFTLTIPALLPLAEGLCAEITGIPHRVDSVQKVAEQWSANEAETWVQLFRDVIARVIYKNYRFGQDTAPY